MKYGQKPTNTYALLKQTSITSSQIRRNSTEKMCASFLIDSLHGSYRNYSYISYNIILIIDVIDRMWNKTPKCQFDSFFVCGFTDLSQIWWYRAKNQSDVNKNWLAFQCTNLIEKWRSLYDPYFDPEISMVPHQSGQTLTFLFNQSQYDLVVGKFLCHLNPHHTFSG